MFFMCFLTLITKIKFGVEKLCNRDESTSDMKFDKGNSIRLLLNRISGFSQIKSGKNINLKNVECSRK